LSGSLFSASIAPGGGGATNSGAGNGGYSSINGRVDGTPGSANQGGGGGGNGSGKAGGSGIVIIRYTTPTP
jgi:hypothetical protein